MRLNFSKQYFGVALAVFCCCQLFSAAVHAGVPSLLDPYSLTKAPTTSKNKSAPTDGNQASSTTAPSSVAAPLVVPTPAASPMSPIIPPLATGTPPSGGVAPIIFFGGGGFSAPPPPPPGS
jgi:hypothetical protein